MYIRFEDINGSDITLAASAIWGVTSPVVPKDTEVMPPSEILLNGAEKSVKIGFATANAIRTILCNEFDVISVDVPTIDVSGIHA